jgi:hypothetical protein
MPAQPSRGEIVVLAGALAALIGSFAPWFSAPSGFSSPNAWDYLAPISLYPLFAGIVSGGVAALRRFGNTTPAFRLGGYSWEQVHVLLGLLALLVGVGFFFSDRPGGLSYGLGFWLTFGGSIALFVGALIMQREPRGPRRVY